MTSSTKLAFLSAAAAALLLGFTATSQAGDGCSWGSNMTVWKPDSSTVADSGTTTPVTKPDHDG